MASAVLEKLRTGVRAILLRKCNIVAATRDGLDTSKVSEIVTAFEKELYNKAIVLWKKELRKEEFKTKYIRIYSAAEIALANSPGIFPDDPLAIQMLRGSISPAIAATDANLFSHENVDPRYICRRMFVRSLIQEPRLGVTGGDLQHCSRRHRQAVLEMATQIEASCYEANIAASKNAEDPYRRHWESAPFLARYSARCATVNSHLDPNGSVCAAYGSELMDRLISGKVLPENLGWMSAAQMCPAATEVQRIEIEIRNQQHVVEKYSELFRCPRRECGKNQCTYVEKQSRSLDEPAKAICKCVCGNKFVVSG